MCFALITGNGRSTRPPFPVTCFRLANACIIVREVYSLMFMFHVSMYMLGVDSTCRSDNKAR